MPSDEIRPFQVRTNAEWERLGLSAATKPEVVDPSEVPENLRPLIPLVERWGINCDVTRGAYFAQQPPTEVDAFYQEVLPHLPAINQWVDEPPRTRAKLQFLCLLKAHSESVPLPSAEKLAASRQSKARIRSAKRKLPGRIKWVFAVGTVLLVM